MADLHPLLDAGPLLSARLALRQRLELVFPPSHFVHEDIPARVTPAAWKKLLRRTPFVGMAWTGAKIAKDSGRVFLGGSQWTVFLATRNEHAPAARIGGAPSAPGLLGMVQVGVMALHGLTIVDVGTTEVSDVANLTLDDKDDEAAAVAGISLTAPYNGSSGIDPGQLDDFLRLGVTWNFDPAVTPDPATDLYPVRTP